MSILSSVKTTHAVEAVKHVHPVQTVKKAKRLSKLVPKSLSRKAGAAALQASQHSPHILFAIGVVGVGATVVTACRATLKVDEIVDEHESNIEKIEKAYALERADYTFRDAQKDKVIAYTQTAAKIARLYGPSIVLGIASIAALTGAHRIQNARIAGLTAAYTATTESFRKYRARVVDELGEDKDKEFLHSSETRTIVEETKNGPKKTEVTHFGKEGTSPYAKLFHDGNINWSPIPEVNLMTLRLQQKNLNDRLAARGHLFLNEVYDELGFERTEAGQIVGWRYYTDEGNGYVDFGVFRDRNLDKFHDFMTGREGELLLDFNVDGPILKKIEKKGRR